MKKTIINTKNAPAPIGPYNQAIKIENMLLSLSSDEREDLKIDGKIIVTCEFCKGEQTYDERRLEKLISTKHDG